MKLNIINQIIILSMFNLIYSCNKDESIKTFAEDLKRLQPIKGIEVLKSGESLVAVSGIYQGRVFTSSSKGMSGRSYGYFNTKLIKNGTYVSNMAALGGESRVWFAPQFGKYALFFDEGVAQTDENIKTPTDLDNVKFIEKERTDYSITYSGKMKVVNDHNYTFSVDLDRQISILNKEQIENKLNIDLNALSYVGFSTRTTMVNVGETQWNKASGLISLWELGCMDTTTDNRVIIPLTKNTDSITEYFTKTTTDRMQIEKGIVFYKADALGLNKIGILPQHTKNVMGSYSKENNLLNIVTFSFPNDGVFVNSLPENKAPYCGDVINIFNGNVDDALGHNWPFYEFESSSVAKELKPGERITHIQSTYHFEGNYTALNEISKNVLGVNLNEIPLF